VSLLRAHREQLSALAHRLLESETLDGADAYAAAGIKRERALGRWPAARSRAGRRHRACRPGPPGAGRGHLTGPAPAVVPHY
jgi:cell division protease FtsH